MWKTLILYVEKLFLAFLMSFFVIYGIILYREVNFYGTNLQYCADQTPSLSCRI